VRVIDLSLLAPGPYCTMLLADLGADVLCVERPPDGPRVDGELAAGAALSRNKRSMCLDLKKREARDVLIALVKRADVFVEGFRPGVTKRLGIDYATLSRDNDRLVYCSITGYGQDGPYAAQSGHDIDYIAVGGALGMIGCGDELAVPMNFIADYAGGSLMAALGILAALIERTRSGRGQYIDVGMSDGVVSLLTRLLGQGRTQLPPGAHMLNGALPHYGVYTCADGRALAVGALEHKFFDRLLAALALDEFADAYVDATRHPALRAALTARFLSRPRDAWLAELALADCCVAPVLDLDEVARDPHHRERAVVTELGGATTSGVVPKLSRTPGALRSPPPRLGQHTDELLRELGFDALIADEGRS
jgi:crotonobetainyl-CoA:carnitine CoA-transferase CaiB-like acyl-CoA transferase